MNVRLIPLRLLGAIAVVAAAMAFAPSAANAHPGHSHGTTAKPAHQSAAPAKAAEPASTRAKVTKVQAFVSAAAQPTAPADEVDCAERGCCSNGPCTGCHSFVDAAVPVTMPALVSSVLIARDALPRGSPDIGRLRRPPKSFA